MSANGNKLNPYRNIREPRCVNGLRPSIVITLVVSITIVRALL